MADYIMKNGEKVELTESLIDEIIKDTEQRIDNGDYRIAYSSENDPARTRPVLFPKKETKPGKDALQR